MAAFAAPALTVLAAVLAAITANWAVAAVALLTGAVASVLLGVLLVRTERRLRLDVAATRIQEARVYTQLHRRSVDEHQKFSGHMSGLLDIATQRIETMRQRLEQLEAEIGRARKAGASRPSAELAMLGEGREWNELWPDLGEAPTVVDLVIWDEQNRPPSQPADSHQERSA